MMSAEHELLSCPRCGWKAGLKVPEVAKMLGTSQQTIRNYIHEGKLPGTVMDAGVSGKPHHVIPVAAIEALLKAKDAAKAAG